MFQKLTIYRAICNRCHRMHPAAAPKSALKTILKKHGWRVTWDDVTCPDCIEKEVGE